MENRHVRLIPNGQNIITSDIGNTTMHRSQQSNDVQDDVVSVSFKYFFLMKEGKARNRLVCINGHDRLRAEYNVHTLLEVL